MGAKKTAKRPTTRGEVVLASFNNDGKLTLPFSNKDEKEKDFGSEDISKTKVSFQGRNDPLSFSNNVLQPRSSCTSLNQMKEPWNHDLGVIGRSTLQGENSEILIKPGPIEREWDHLRAKRGHGVDNPFALPLLLATESLFSISPEKSNMLLSRGSVAPSSFMKGMDTRPPSPGHDSPASVPPAIVITANVSSVTVSPTCANDSEPDVEKGNQHWSHDPSPFSVRRGVLEQTPSTLSQSFEITPEPMNLSRTCFPTWQQIDGVTVIGGEQPTENTNFFPTSHRYVIDDEAAKSCCCGVQQNIITLPPHMNKSHWEQDDIIQNVTRSFIPKQPIPELHISHPQPKWSDRSCRQFHNAMPHAQTMWYHQNEPQQDNGNHWTMNCHPSHVQPQYSL